MTLENKMGVGHSQKEWLTDTRLMLYAFDRGRGQHNKIPWCWLEYRLQGPGTGKSHTRLGFKSRSEHIWWFDLNYKDLIQKNAIWSEIWLNIFDIRCEKKLYRAKSAACLWTQNGMHERSKHFCFMCNLMPKLHRTNWLTVIVHVLWLRCTFITCDWEDQSIKYSESNNSRHLHFLMKIRLHIHSCERFEIWPRKIWDLEEKWRRAIWQNDFNPFPGDLSWGFDFRFAHTRKTVTVIVKYTPKIDDRRVLIDIEISHCWQSAVHSTHS